jgi:DNA/RNA endonuclease YhcR with UshA esterase domain
MPHNTLPRRVIALLWAALSLSVPARALAGDAPIADARSSSGVVTIRGVVTVAAGAFASSTFDQGFALQDDTGGIYVSIEDNPGLTVGQRVQVTGSTGDDGYGLAVLRVASVSDVLPTKGIPKPVPRRVTTGEVGEATEGVLATVSGTITRGPTNDMPYGYSVFVDDGTGETQVFMPASTGLNPFRISFAKVGNRIRVTGFGGQYKSQYEVMPRFRSDIVALP